MKFKSGNWIMAYLCVAWVCGAGLGGCKINQGPGPIEQAQTQFQSGHYAEAYNLASRSAATAGGQQRYLAHYLAGISAYRLNNLSAAERYLKVAASSNDQSLAADARSTLGLIYSQQGRYAQAAETLLSGARLQHGDDRAQAYLYAGIALQKIGRWPQARTSLLLARQSTRDPGLIDRIDQQLAVTGYTIQVGAFKEKENADRLASTLAPRAASVSAGPVIVVPKIGPDGRTIHLVQVGRFATFGAANRMRQVLGQSGAVIVPLEK